MKFSQATSSVNPISLQVKATASNMEKGAKKAPKRVTLVLSTNPKKVTFNEPSESSVDSDDEEFESPVAAPVV